MFALLLANSNVFKSTLESSRKGDGFYGHQHGYPKSVFVTDDDDSEVVGWNHVIQGDDILYVCYHTENGDIINISKCGLVSVLGDRDGIPWNALAYGVDHPITWEVTRLEDEVHWHPYITNAHLSIQLFHEFIKEKFL